MSEQRKVPKLRFPEFTDDWEQREFTELVTIERGGSPRPIDQFITDDVNGLNWIKIGDAPLHGNYITSTKEKIKPEGLSKTREVFPGDLILSNSMSFGRPYIMGIKGCIHDGWLAIKDPNKHFDLFFLCILLGSDVMLQQYKSLAAGSTVNNLNKELVGKTTVSYPSKAEQQKIGACLWKLDNLITLHQRKCEVLKKLKKGLLQKMFPKDGTNIPEIRFPEFSDAWEQRKLGDISSLITKGTTPKDKSGTGEVNFIKVENINDFSGNITGMSKISLEEHQGYLKRSQLQEGDILFSIAGTLGRVTSVNKAVLPANTNQALSIIRLKEGNLEYVKTCLKGKVVTDFIRRNPTIGAQPNLSLEQVSNLEIKIPSESEQKKIGEYFSNLDNLITLHQRKLEVLKKLKKGLLQQMFV